MSTALAAAISAVAASGALAGASGPQARNGKLAYTALESAAQMFVVPGDQNGGGWLFERNDLAELTPVMSPDGARVAYNAMQDGNFEIFVRNVDGSGLRQLTTDPADDQSPEWSPDSQRIAFSTQRGSSDDIYVVGADGTGLAPLVASPAIEVTPAWSPDGTKIAFSSNRDGDFEIYSMRVDGTGLTRLTVNSEDDYFPAWSPDGSRIAFASFRDGDSEIFVMNADGTSPTQLTVNEYLNDWDPAWSPDGQRITFTSDRDDNLEIYSMSADGTSVRNVTQWDASDEYGASWTPDNRIVFTSSAVAKMGVEIAGQDGSQRRLFRSSTREDLLPKWAPDGKRLAFASLRDGDLEIYVAPTAGAAVRQLTRNRDIQDLYPAWSPDARRLAFIRLGSDGASALYVMSVSGRGARFVMEGDDLCCPAWSPDGSRIALARDGDIIVVATSGRGVRVLTGAGGNARPSMVTGWTLDRLRLRSRGGQQDIYVVSSRGGPVKRLTRGDGPNWGPDWSPDGKLIAFSKGDLQPMTAVLYVMAANGSGVRRVPLPVPAVLPDWQPVK